MSKKAKLEELEKTLIETSDIALLRRDLNTMIHTLTATLKGVLEVAKDLNAEVEALTAKPKKVAKPKTKAKTAAAKRTVTKAINLDPKA